MKIKTNELTRAALDWAVAVAEYGYGADYKTNRYSTDWAQGGPIIERERIQIRPFTGSVGQFWTAYFGQHGPCMDGPTPLIAAMRCYVASKLGDEVEVPEELM